ncbi:MAG: MBL fold metallo-hydrolase [Candidatus Nealsonbacteria bacterium CG_4_10_14_0_2_um_filter_38_17]|uniref:MBL fold metallo-hydrolase n=2 Tax=Candidatus Nealsoniibacteriota TaxID=1817911 RepID=A0A2M7UX54_9BACT|nr:MAG: competence protein ComEC [Candidatus Nealsonbacteria bacterium CG23_combo_of_CG06-09_8_20_14_all_38_19]PIZ88563.1 MAG: MBL fold metallo-hydrolase [Candidatus Nealsonbacteria bacterium CG_4_10_14_0_2_um_filter_38_17]
MRGDKAKNSTIFIFGLLVILNSLAWITVYNLSKPRLLEVDFFDVGQGDSIFIETPQKYQVLIDGGPSSKIIEKLGKVMPFYDRSLDLVILTHPDPDHLVGLIDVLKNYNVNLIGFTGVVSSNPEFIEWKSQISSKHTPLIVLTKNEKILLGKEVYMYILAPLESFEGREVKDFNSSSIVARLVFKNSSFLFTGDTPKSVEKELVENKSNIDSDVLKVGHHGSKTSTSDIFLQAVTPENAVIQVGKDNRYGHPHQEVLDRLQNYGIKILRTDQDSDIKIISDGENFKIK